MSPKNKGKLGKSESEIPETDEFLSTVDRIVEAARPHSKLLITLGSLLAVALVGWAVWDWYETRKELQSTSAYVDAMKLGGGPIVGADETAPEAAAPGLEPPPTFADRDSKLAAQLAAIKSVRSQFSGTGVAELARLDQARLLFEQGDFAAAANLWKEVASSDAPALLRIAARENVGYSLEAQALASEDAATRQQGLEAALDAFTAMQPKPEGPRRDYAIYHRGRILAELGRKDEAIEAFQQLLVEHSESPLEPATEVRLAALGAKS